MSGRSRASVCSAQPSAARQAALNLLGGTGARCSAIAAGGVGSSGGGGRLQPQSLRKRRSGRSSIRRCCRYFSRCGWRTACWGRGLLGCGCGHAEVVADQDVGEGKAKHLDKVSVVSAYASRCCCRPVSVCRSCCKPRFDRDQDCVRVGSAQKGDRSSAREVCRRRTDACGGSRRLR